MNEFKPLPRDFYLSSAGEVAPELLGHYLLRRTSGGICGGPIVEVEAYLTDDAACHGAVGLTPRNQVMFGGPGYAYVYLIYGYHFCVNAVCQPAGVAEAVLIRAIEPEFGLEQMRASRPVKHPGELTNGPAKLCQALNIARKLDGTDLCDASSPFYIARNPGLKAYRNAQGSIVTTTRVGITRAAALPLRFYLAQNKHVSKPVTVSCR